MSTSPKLLIPLFWIAAGAKPEMGRDGLQCNGDDQELTEISEVVVVSDLNLLDELEVPEEDGRLRPVPEQPKPVALEGVVVSQEGLLEAHSEDVPVAPEPVGFNSGQMIPLFELVLQ